MSEGTLHNGVGDARVEGLQGVRQTEAETDACIAALEHSRRQLREATREASAAESRADHKGAAAEVSMSASDAWDSLPLPLLFDRLPGFVHRPASDGGAELKLYDAMSWLRVPCMFWDGSVRGLEARTVGRPTPPVRPEATCSKSPGVASVGASPATTGCMVGADSC